VLLEQSLRIQAIPAKKTIRRSLVPQPAEMEAVLNAPDVTTVWVSAIVRCFTLALPQACACRS